MIIVNSKGARLYYLHVLALCSFVFTYCPVITKQLLDYTAGSSNLQEKIMMFYFYFVYKSEL